MAYGDLKYLPRRTSSDKVLHNKALNIAKNLKNDEYQCRLVSMAYKGFRKSLLPPKQHKLIQYLRPINQLKNVINQLLENSRTLKFILP